MNTISKTQNTVQGVALCVMLLLLIIQPTTAISVSERANKNTYEVKLYKQGHNYDIKKCLYFKGADGIIDTFDDEYGDCDKYTSVTKSKKTTTKQAPEVTYFKFWYKAEQDWNNIQFRNCPVESGYLMSSALQQTDSTTFCKFFQVDLQTSPWGVIIDCNKAVNC